MIAGSPIGSNPLMSIGAALDIGDNTEVGVLIVEDGTGKSGANSYVTYEEFSDYFEYQPRDVSVYLQSAVEGKLIAAALILTYRYRYCGKKTFPTQALSFPRTGSYDRDNRKVGSTEIPQYIKIAQMELAYWLLINQGKTGFESNDGTQATNEFKEIEVFQGIRVEYKDGSKFKPLPDLIQEILSPCGRKAGGSGTFFIERS
jgi:hypothetical protein